MQENNAKNSSNLNSERMDNSIYKSIGDAGLHHVKEDDDIEKWFRFKKNNNKNIINFQSIYKFK